MSTHRAITVLGLLIASCTGLVACGGSSGQLSKSETITQAGAICDRASKQARQYAVGRTLPNSPVEFNSAIEEDTRIARQTESALGQLNPVSDGRESLDRFVAAQAAIVRANVAQLAAFKSLDQSKIQASIDDLLSATGDAKKAAHEYGLDGCPYIPVSIQLSRQSAKNSSQAGLASPGDAVGHWTGPVTQYGPGTNTLRYVVKMNVDVIGRTPGKIVGTTLYPSLHCGGRSAGSSASPATANAAPGAYHLHDVVMRGRENNLRDGVGQFNVMALGGEGNRGRGHTPPDRTAPAKARLLTRRDAAVCSNAFSGVEQVPLGRAGFP